MKAALCVLSCLAVLFLGGCSPEKYDTLFPARTNTLNDDTLAMLKYLPGSYTLVSAKEADGRKVMQWYLGALADGQEKGFMPLIIIPSTTLAQTAEYNFEESKSLTAMMKEANEIYLERYKEEAANEVPWLPPASCNAEFFLFSQFAEEIILALFPTKNPWELAIYMPMGGFNGCPTPKEQVAVFRHFYHRYGAIPAVVAFDTWELFAINPPKQEQDVDTLAREMVSFCPDMYEAGELAWEYRQPDIWMFWWD